MRILVAEDEDLVRRTILVTLRKTGHEIVEAENGAVAWDYFQRADAPDLVVLDLMLPEINGLDVLRRIRGMPDRPQPYVLMVTARGEKEDIVMGLNAGANDYLSKPFDRGELLARVEVGIRMVEMRLALDTKIKELESALEQIKTLRGILPICSHCKKIRDDQGYWSEVEEYLLQHSDAEFSHALCPSCMKTLYPDFS